MRGRLFVLPLVILALLVSAVPASAQRCVTVYYTAAPRASRTASCGSRSQPCMSGAWAVQVAIRRCPSGAKTVCSSNSGRCHQFKPADQIHREPLDVTILRLLLAFAGLAVGVALGWLLYRRRTAARSTVGAPAPS